MDRELSLADYVEVLRRRWLFVVAGIAIGVALAVAYSQSQERLYRASTTVLVTANDSTAIVAPGQFGDDTGSSGNALANEAVFAQTVRVSSAVAERIGEEAVVSVSNSADADVLTFSVVDDDPVRAAEIADIYVEVFIEKRREALVEEFGEVAGQVQAQIDAIDGQLAGLAESDSTRGPLETRREALIINLQELSLASQLSGGSRAEIVTSAEVPTSPFQPKTNRDLFLGILAGLMVGVAAAFAREFLDNRVRGPEALEVLDQRMVALATIPTTEKKSKDRIVSLDEPDGVASEAYRRLRAAIVFLSERHGVRVFEVTSASPGEGKTTTVANAAVALARSGKRVVVVDADLRRPCQHKMFDIACEPGIVDVIVGTHEPDEVARKPISNIPLAVLPAGSPLPNPGELLGTTAMRDVLDSLAAVADIVLVDSPPLLAVSDALAMAQIVDGTVLVVRDRSTRTKDIRRALDALERVDAHVVGAVLNKVKRSRRHDYDGYLSSRRTVTPPAAAGASKGAGSARAGEKSRRRGKGNRRMLDPAVIPSDAAMSTQPTQPTVKASSAEAPAKGWIA